MEPGFPPPEIDTSRPHPARLYNYYLGGTDNYPVDREAAAVLLRTLPEAREIARQNRLFLQRVVRHLVTEAGIRQIIDIGTGIPAAATRLRPAAISRYRMARPTFTSLVLPAWLRPCIRRRPHRW